MSTAEKNERPEQNQDLRCQSGPSAKDSVIFSGGDSSKNYGADQQRLQIPDLHLTNSLTPATFACWKIRFKTDVCTCSQFPKEAMQWIKEVELVDSVDDYEAWKNRVAGVRAERDYSDFEDVKGESAEFEWNIFPGFTTLQLCDKVNDLLSNLGQTPATFTGRGHTAS